MFVLFKRLQHLRRSAALPAPASGGSLALRHVDCGSCNGCEHELTNTAGPHYDLDRFGLSIVASPRHADVLLITGSITTRMVEPLRAAYAAMPEPRLVAALGDCALGAGVIGDPTQIAGSARRHPPRRHPHPRLPAHTHRDRRGARHRDRPHAPTPGRHTRGPASSVIILGHDGRRPPAGDGCLTNWSVVACRLHGMHPRQRLVIRPAPMGTRTALGVPDDDQRQGQETAVLQALPSVQ